MEVLHMLAKACFKGNNLERAELNFKLALEKAQKLGNKEFQVEVLDELGQLCVAVKKYQTAITFLKEGKTLANQANLKTKAMNILENLSMAYMQSGKHKKALESLDGALELAKKLGDNRGQGIILKKMGDYHKSLKEFPRAIEKYERGMPKIRKYAIIPLEYSLLENLGNSYLEIDRFEKAMICFRHSRTLGKKSGDRFMEANSVWNMSRTCQESGESSKAMSYAELATKLCSDVQTDDGIKKLAAEIKEWMIKKVEGEIKDSGL